MDSERERIQDDLRGLIAGEVRCDDIYLRLYASDASIYEIRPRGVVYPRHTDDVVACVRYASENGLAIHPRGAGTGLAGGALGEGLVLDMSRSMRRILETGDDYVRVQPGVVHAQLNRHLAAHGRQFGPDPAMSQVTTMGSVVAVAASGSRSLRYGSARERVRSLEVVLADGEVMQLGEESLDWEQAAGCSLRRRDLLGQLADLLSSQREAIERGRPRSRFNTAGYELADVLVDGRLRMPRLLAGSEGTLGLFTEITLATDPLPACRGVLLLFFESLQMAARAVQEILPLEVSACDLMDRRHLSLARESDVRYDLLIPAEAEAVLLVEQEGETADDVRRSLGLVDERVRRRAGLAFASQLAMDAEDVALYWRLARDFVPTLYRLKGSERPLPFVEDVAVPPETLPEFFVRLQNVLKRHQVTASLFGHVGHGQLHVRPFLDLASDADVGKMERLAAELFAEAIAVGGTISGEHGDGLSRTPFLLEQYGQLCDLFREVKRIFDPHNILNPGKIVSHPPVPLTRNLRPVRAPQETAPPETVPMEPGGETPVIELQLNWQPEEMALAARQCNGCGACRTTAPDARMCPIFRFAPREVASPRAKANLVRAVLTGQLDRSALDRDDFKQAADLCVHCHQCRLECPAAVDIPRLMAEAKGAYVRTNGLRPSDWLMSRIDRLSAAAGRLPRIANWAIRNRQARWLIEKTTGIAQGRKLPRLAGRSFMRQAARRNLTRPNRHAATKVLYFVDTYANHHDTQLAEAVVQIFEHNGVSVYVHPDQQPAGMPLIAAGALEPARKVAARNVALLADAVRQGYTIVASEPSAALCLTHEYLYLVDDEDAQLVADQTRDACHYLWALHLAGRLQLDFQPLSASVAYHEPCHLRALGIGSPGENLLRLVPGLNVTRPADSCSGMAGTYGLQRANYRNSLRAGWDLISALRDAPVQVGTTECSTCKMQMEQGTSKATIHPLKLLALAYGLMPELADLLTITGEPLVVT